MESVSLEVIIGNNVAKYRSAAGLTQQELAEKVGISVAFVSRVERGQKMMKGKTLYATAQALDVSCDALLSQNLSEAHRANIERFLSQQADEYLAGIEKLIRICTEEFKPKYEKG